MGTVDEKKGEGGEKKKAVPKEDWDGKWIMGCGWKKKKTRGPNNFFQLCLVWELGPGNSEARGEETAQDGRKIVAQGGTVSGRAVDW